MEAGQRIRKRRKREDKSRRSSPATAAVPELGDRGRNERREEEGEAVSACAIKAISELVPQRTPPDWGGDDDGLSGPTTWRPRGGRCHRHAMAVGAKRQALRQGGQLRASGTENHGGISTQMLPLVGNEAQ